MQVVRGARYRRSQIQDQLGGQRQGGISTPAGSGYLMIFSSPRGRDYGYEDGWDRDGFYHYTGEGQRGDMRMTRGNRAVARSGKPIMLFEKSERDADYVFTGWMDYVDHYWMEAPDVDGVMRSAIKFRLMAIEGLLQDDTPSGDDFPLGFLERRCEASRLLPSSKQEARIEVVQYKLRSRQVAKYALERSSGFCELCGNYAPFLRTRGSPYLEVHHLTKLSDDGLDHPSHVAAVCPTCHRRLHYGHDGDQLNAELQRGVSMLEQAIDRGRFVLVVGAIAMDQRGRIFVTARDGGHLSGMWEFPGGKVESQETLEDALERELAEELCVQITNPVPAFRADYDYEDVFVRLLTFSCGIEGIPRLNQHSGSRWVRAHDLGSLPMAPADEIIAHHLVDNRYSTPTS